MRISPSPSSPSTSSSSLSSSTGGQTAPRSSSRCAARRGHRVPEAPSDTTEDIASQLEPVLSPHPRDHHYRARGMNPFDRPRPDTASSHHHHQHQKTTTSSCADTAPPDVLVDSDDESPDLHLQHSSLSQPLLSGPSPRHLQGPPPPSGGPHRDGEESSDDNRQRHHCLDSNRNSSETDLEPRGRDSMSRPPYHRPSEGRSQVSLLQNSDQRPPSYSSSEAPSRPAFITRRSTFHERDPAENANAATRKKYTYAAFFLGLSLISFVIQTETAVYIQSNLGWNKAYCMLWLTHGSWSLLWPVQLLILRIQKRKDPWKAFWRRHCYLLRTTAQMIESQDLHPSGRAAQKSPIPHMLKMTAIVTSFLTIAGGSWYVAVDLTSPSDLTAIYNCSAFFAYAFSIPLLHEKPRFDKIFAVAVAIVGVLVVAYGDSAQTKHGGQSGGAVGGGPPAQDSEAKNRTVGNIVIGVGSVLYGLYEVLYKKLACPPEGTSPGRGMIFANTFGSLIGSFTLLVLWIPLPILHVTGVEKFALPQGEAAWMLLISVLANATFSGSFLVLISLTSPVLSSVAALLTIFLVAVVDWLLTGTRLSAAAIAGGLLIIAAFALLTFSTYREMAEERRRKEEVLSESESESDE
ncbi:MAG: hypothetical protein M1819_005648 [Sarea resinae]|nr:MAG: hypothetical protein M1819_005648 [Sarea resinae]